MMYLPALDSFEDMFHNIFDPNDYFCCTRKEKNTVL